MRPRKVILVLHPDADACGVLRLTLEVNGYRQELTCVFCEVA